MTAYAMRSHLFLNIDRLALRQHHIVFSKSRIEEWPIGYPEGIKQGSV